MTPQIRVFLWVGLGFLLYLNAQAWMKAYPPGGPPTPAAAESTVARARRQSGGQPLCGAADSFRGSGAHSRAGNDSSGIDRGTGGGDRARSASAPTSSTWTRAWPAPNLCARTSCNTRRHKDDPTTPVRLFSTDSPDTQFLFQSGLTTGEAGRSEPNHKAAFTSAAAEYRLADGADALEVPFTWSDGAGLTVTKTFVFHRGSYRVDLRYQVANAGAAPVKLASYAQFLRHSLGNKRSMWDPETYAFRGPAYFDGKRLQEARHRGRGRRAVLAAGHRRLGRRDAAPLRRRDRAAGDAAVPI